MLAYPHIDPIALSLGPLKVHWYGIMYLIGFVGAWALGVLRAKKPYTVLATNQVGDAIFYGAIGVIAGGRLGYMLLYDFSNFIHHPWVIAEIWDGGMSFHGGMIGVFIASLLYSWKIKISIWDLLDFFAPLVPIGLGAGRVGNFINGELWGRVTDSSIGMIFPTGGPLPRYPSQLVEFFLEGVVLFTILWAASAKPRQRFTLAALFLLFYGIFRFSVEFLRQPDPQMGYVLFGWVTQGQILSLPMILGGGIALVYLSLRKNKVYSPDAQKYLNEK